MTAQNEQVQVTSDVVIDQLCDATMYIHALCEDLMCCSNALGEVSHKCFVTKDRSELVHLIGEASDLISEIVSDHENDVITHLDGILNQITEKTDDSLSS